MRRSSLQLLCLARKMWGSILAVTQGPPVFSPLSPPFQVNLCYLCQACTSLLHSRKMLQHYLQVNGRARLGASPIWPARTLGLGSPLTRISFQAKNGESLPSAVLPRLQRAPQTSAKPASPESEAAEQRALSTVQYSLLKILSKCLAALRHFTPDICQILLDQVEEPKASRGNKEFVLSGVSPKVLFSTGLPCFSLRTFRFSSKKLPQL